MCGQCFFVCMFWYGSRFVGGIGVTCSMMQSISLLECPSWVKTAFRFEVGAMSTFSDDSGV